MERKQGRGARGPKNRPGRRTPPPSQTGAERIYLNRQVAEGANLKLDMSDGEQLEGKLVEHDRDQLTLEKDGRRFIVRKREIRFIAE